MAQSVSLEDALRIARVIIDTTDIDVATAASNPAIPENLRAEVIERLESERIIQIRDPRMVEDPQRGHQDWLHLVDREGWYYWRRLREYLIDTMGRPEAVARAIDRATDKILGAMEDPRGGRTFDTRGLVVGYVQSGKTANYAALIAKAADCGYHLVIVLTGIHNALRQQTQRRLTAELVGLDDQGHRVGVGPPPPERRWHTFTSSQLNGDFNPGLANTTLLGGSNPVLIVAKKWVSVLRAMNSWFDRAPPGVLGDLPVLIIDDEADQASPNTGGDRAPDEDDDGDTLEEVTPSRTNELIRSLIQRFSRVAYIAYTATPFANVLIDHNAIDREAGEDLYPRSFIVDLPHPPGYWGAERIFGLSDDEINNWDGMSALDVLRRVPDEEVSLLVPIRRSDVETFQPQLTESLKSALDSYVLAGAARLDRGHGDEPATMLVHTSHRTTIQGRLTVLIREHLESCRDEWRYFRQRGIEARLRSLWDRDFRPVIRSQDVDMDLGFSAISEAVGTLYEQLQVRQINSDSLDELDYQREPDLKVVVVGGNRLSRGLTLEGLLISYYVRPARAYDTLLQMARWFGFRDHYADLTRIYTTTMLEQWFRDLAAVELEVREDIRRYELEGLTPIEFGVRVRRHPAMLVTSPLKMQHAQITDLSFSNKIRQTINFRFDDPGWLRQNFEVTRNFLSGLGMPVMWKEGQPMWSGVSRESVIRFLQEYRMDPSAVQMKSEPLWGYIQRQAEHDELSGWIVAVMGQARHEERLGAQLDLGIIGSEGIIPINPIERTRLRDTNTLKAIASPPDQGVGLGPRQIEEARAGVGGSLGERLRAQRDPSEGLLLVYPISRYSGHGRRTAGEVREHRVPIFERPEEGTDVIGIAVVFPISGSAATREYLTGTVQPEFE